MRFLHIPPHREHLASYLVFLVTSGSGELEFNGKSYPLRAGDCVFIDCRKPYSHATSTDLWTLQWCHFYGHIMPDIYKKYQERGECLYFIRKKFRSWFRL
ncbi:MAG: cupin domain-containing protein [Fusicatenibacter saccharivorans]